MEINPPNNFYENITSSSLRLFLQLVFKRFIGPPQNARTQRFILGLITPLLLGVSGVKKEFHKLSNCEVEILNPPINTLNKVILYIHGGAFCIGNPKTHRAITTRLALLTGHSIWTPDYRLAPEHPYPAGLNDILECYMKLQDLGFTTNQIIIGGDSAGGSLALALALKLKSLEIPQPKKIFLISPVTDFHDQEFKASLPDKLDPMISIGWMKQAFDWYRYDSNDAFHDPLTQDLSGLPPILIQAGGQEILLRDSLRLFEVAQKFKVKSNLQIYKKRWHVFHLQAAYLKSAREAINEIAIFVTLD